MCEDETEEEWAARIDALMPRRNQGKATEEAVLGALQRGESRTLADIGRELGLSRQRISQIIKKLRSKRIVDKTVN